MNKKQILAYSRKFKKRLAEAAIAGALEEVEIYDKRDNLVLTPDLKVKHKSSGYEYTVDHVEGEGAEAVVHLRHPEAPRVEPSDAETALTEKTTINVKDLRPQNMAAMTPEDNADTMPAQLSLAKEPEVQEPKGEDAESTDPSLVSVSKSEFEKNYEVE